jgi:hypothetical protein
LYFKPAYIWVNLETVVQKVYSIFANAPHMDFSDNFCNIKKFVQVDIQKNYEKSPQFFFGPLPEKRRRPENFSNHQNWTYISARLLCKIFRKIGPPRASEYNSNPIVKISGTDNRQLKKIFPIPNLTSNSKTPLKTGFWGYVGVF